MPPDRTQAPFPQPCWRCAHWGGLVARTHARCTRLNAPLQASPRFGCAYWTPGAGSALPLDWLPPGYEVPVPVVVWGAHLPAAERAPLPPPCERPTNTCDAFKYDQQQEARAWKTADAAMARARAR